MLSVRPAAVRAHLRSHSSPNAGAVLAHAPTAPEYAIPSHLFRVIVLERLQLPLLFAQATCSGCQAPLDPHGRHRASCPRTGRVKERAGPVERVMARTCREAGARVRFNAFLRDMNIGVRATDVRRVKVLAQDLVCFGGAQLAVDVTLRGVLSRAGELHPHAADVDGAVLLEARRDKETTYPEVVASGRCWLVVVVIETGGRWSDEAVDFSNPVGVRQSARGAHVCQRGGSGCFPPCALSHSRHLWWSRQLSVSRGAGQEVRLATWRSLHGRRFDIFT